MNQENLQADMISLFQETAEYAKKFHKKTYASDMDILLNRHGALLGRIREASRCQMRRWQRLPLSSRIMRRSSWRRCLQKGRGIWPVLTLI